MRKNTVFLEDLSVNSDAFDALDAVVNESVDILNERSIVKMDKVAMRKKLMTRAILAAAKNANDPLYVKYQKASKLRRACRQAIAKKYAAQGKAIYRQYLAAQKEAKVAKK